MKHTADNWNFQLDADLLTLNLENESIGSVPADIIQTFILKTPGDFCISKDGKWRISVKGEDGKTHGLAVEKRTNGKLGITGLLHGEGDTLGELIYELRDPTVNYLSGALGSPVFPRTLIKKKELEELKLIQRSNILSWEEYHSGKEDDFKYARAIILVSEKQLPVILKRNRTMESSEWNKLLYEEFRISLICNRQKLPVFCSIGAVIEEPTLLIYPTTNGIGLHEFLAENLATMNIGTRIEICRALCSVMSELHAVEIYHGAPSVRNYYVKSRKQNNANDIRIMFNGTQGLAPKSLLKSTDGLDLSVLAPECSETRVLSPQSGVYSLGKMLLELMKGCEQMSSDDNIGLVREMASIIAGCMHSRPHERPTMDGIFLKLKKMCETRTKSADEKWKIY